MNSSGAVSGNADKYLPSFVQKKASVSFLQLSVGSKNPSQARVAEFLREKGSAINSRVLSALAVRVAEDPFVKVKKMIKDLIVRLMEEANEEAEHKGWCRALFLSVFLSGFVQCDSDEHRCVVGRLGHV